MPTDTLETQIERTSDTMKHEPELSIVNDKLLELEFSSSALPAVDVQGLYLQSKYAFDRVVGCLSLLILSPLIFALWGLVKFTSPGPGFYRQLRTGLNQRPFYIYKLRTMYIDAESAGIQWAKAKDGRITPLGFWLRKLHLDELPQLFNVASGDMSLVGPRPERPEIIRSLEILIPDYQRRHNVKPGITGLAQINLEPDRNINDTREKQLLDLRYIRLASPWLDGRMIFATLLRVIGIKGENVIKMTGLKQTLSHRELMSVDYQFNTAPEDLWNPQKGPVYEVPVQSPAKSDLCLDFKVSRAQG